MLDGASAIATLPEALEAERAILGSVLLWDDPQEAAKIVAELEPGVFFRAPHRVIFGVMRELAGQGSPCDLVSVTSRLREIGKLEAAGGSLYLSDLLGSLTTTTMTPYFAKILREKAVRRSMIEAGGRLCELGFNEVVGVETQLAKAQDLFASLSGNGCGGPSSSSWEELDDAIGPIAWSWPGWLPNGFLVLLAGDPGSGKSALALRVAASFLDGRDWPDGSPFGGATGSVLWCEAESAQAIHLSRARAWGLPLEKIRTPFPDPLADVRLDDPATMRRIRMTAADPDVRLVIVDSFSGSHRRDEKTLDAGWLAQSLATLARDTGKPILACHHLRKRSTEELPEVSLDRVRGSSSIVQFTRVVWGLDQPNLEQPDRRRFLQIKNNLSRFAPALGFEIDEHGVQFVEAPVRPHVDSQVGRAADLLLALLRVRPRPASEIRREADGAGLSWRSMERAKGKLGIVAVRKDEAWLWSLPAGDVCPF